MRKIGYALMKAQINRSTPVRSFLHTRIHMRHSSEIMPSCFHEVHQMTSPIIAQTSRRFISNSEPSSVKIDRYTVTDASLTSQNLENFNTVEFLKLGYIEREKNIAESQRAVREAFGTGSYREAFECAQVLEQQCLAHFKDEHPVYASALNNVAVMHRQLGRYDKAVDYYLKALQVYKKAFKNEEHPSFATTLVNCGLAFRSLADESKHMERIAFKERALEHFERAVEIRTKVLEEGHPDLEISRNLLALAQASLGKDTDAEGTLRRSVENLIGRVGINHHVTATAMNNLAFYLATQEGTSMEKRGADKSERGVEALTWYEHAQSARVELLGEKHPDTVAVRHNIAELLDRLGRIEEALEMRKLILSSLGITDEDIYDDDIDEIRETDAEEKWNNMVNSEVARKQQDSVGVQIDNSNGNMHSAKMSKSGRPMRPNIP